jgi:archaellum biogenesis protein FlaJ (TadC family)
MISSTPSKGVSSKATSIGIFNISKAIKMISLILTILTGPHNLMYSQIKWLNKNSPLSFRLLIGITDAHNISLSNLSKCTGLTSITDTQRYALSCKNLSQTKFILHQFEHTGQKNVNFPFTLSGMLIGLHKKKQTWTAKTTTTTMDGSANG